MDICGETAKRRHNTKAVHRREKKKMESKIKNKDTFFYFYFDRC
jgi:hypothetical protein